PRPGRSARAATRGPAMTPDDLDFLLTEAGRDLLDLAEGLEWSRASLVASTARVRRADPDRAAAVIDVVTARRRARDRLRGAERMLLTDEAVQQATAWPVSALRARRLAGRDVHDLTCSIGAELSELARTTGRLVGTDLDPLRARMAAHNVPQALVGVADALRPPSRDAVRLADPARRSGGRRIHDPARLSPPPPGLDTRELDHAGEVQLVSLDGAVREACLWSPGLSSGVRSRATVIRSGAPDGPAPWGPPPLVTEGVALHVEEVTDLDDDEVDALPEPDRYIVEPDGAVVRAGLVRHWARRHGLRQLDPRIAHLTGPEIPVGHTGFEVLRRCRLDRKELRREL